MHSRPALQQAKERSKRCLEPRQIVLGATLRNTVKGRSIIKITFEIRQIRGEAIVVSLRKRGRPAEEKGRGKRCRRMP